jgi:hypothetical protein
MSAMMIADDGDITSFAAFLQGRISILLNPLAPLWHFVSLLGRHFDSVYFQIP